jgi:hypothetical protein
MKVHCTFYSRKLMRVGVLKTLPLSKLKNQYSSNTHDHVRNIIQHPIDTILKLHFVSLAWGKGSA